MTLHVKEPRPSIWDSFGPDFVRGRQEAAERENELRQRHTADSKMRADKAPDLDYHDGELPDTPLQPTNATDVSSNHSLMRVCSVLFALE
jgi:hypothetical protein